MGTYDDLKRDLDATVDRVRGHRAALQDAASSVREAAVTMLGAPDEAVNIELPDGEDEADFLGPRGEAADARLLKFDLVVQFGDGKGALIHEARVPVKLRRNRFGIELSIAGEGPFQWQPGANVGYAVENALSESLRKSVNKRVDRSILVN